MARFRSDDSKAPQSRTFVIRVIVLVLVAIGLTFLGSRLLSANKQHNAIEAINRHSGVAEFMSCVLYDFETNELGELSETEPQRLWLQDLLGADLCSDVSSVELRAGNSDDDIRYLAAFPRLRRISLEGPNLTGSSLCELAKMRRSGLLTNVREIEVDGINVTETGIESLGEFVNIKKLAIVSVGKITSRAFRFLRHLNDLEALTVKTSGVSDESLLDFQQLKSLRFLSLEGPGITNAGLARVGSLSRLETIYLDCPNVTGSGLLSLGSLKKLNDLEAGEEIRITSEEANELKRRLPNCKVLPSARSRESGAQIH